MTEIENIIASEEYKTIEKDVEAFVKEKLNGYLPENRGEKTIHDPVWGSVDYSGWEMQLIDSPLFQRLRDINQVGLAVLTYPAARHSRFEHSLGVASAAKMMCDKIDKNSKDYTIPDAFRNRIVLAALLHDIGHCFYSHLSETIYGDLKEFAELRKVFNSFLELKPKPHEILSFVIINTESFKEFFEEYVKYPEDSIKTNKLMQDIGCMIIGQNIEDGKNIIREIAFDRWGAVQMVQNLEGMGFTVVPFGQGFKDMSPPTKELMKLVLENKIAHGGHPVLRWNMDNIYIRQDPAGNIKADKEKSSEKIDGAIATIMALDRAIRCFGQSQDSVYDSRGLLFI